MWSSIKKEQKERTKIEIRLEKTKIVRNQWWKFSKSR